MDEHQLHRAIRSAELVQKYLGEQLNEEERTELESWIEESDANRQLFSELTDPAALNKSLQEMYSLNKWKSYSKLQEQLFPKAQGVVPIIRSRWYGAAAMIIGVVLVGTLVTYSIPNRNTNLLTGIGDMAKSGKAAITHSEGTVAVSASKQSSRKVHLKDGSTVLLQPASAVRYPVAFSGNDRKVAVAGEARFDVAKNEHTPLTVQISENLNVSVTDSQFTVKAHPDETVVTSPTIRVTQGSDGGISISTDPGYKLYVAVNATTGVITYTAVKRADIPLGSDAKKDSKQ